MSSEKNTGEISQRQCRHIQWTIKKISYTKVGQRLQSPKFFIGDSEWCLQLYHNTVDISNGQYEEWMGLHLRRGNGSTYDRVNYHFGIKNQDGTVEEILPELSHVFNEQNPSHGYNQWFDRNDLLKKKSELAPSDSFTITCNIRMSAAKIDSCFEKNLMSGEAETGEISQRQCHHIEWTIKNIFSYTGVKQRLQSPKFSLFDSNWFLKLYPNGLSWPPEGWMGLYMVRENGSTSNAVVNFSFGIRQEDGAIKTIKSEISRVFNEEIVSWGFSKWLQRVNLLERIGIGPNEMATSNYSLIISCNLRMKDDDLKTASSGLEKLSDDFRNMFLSRKGCDATLKVQNEEFPINTSILAARSPVFEAMFEADMQEKNTGVADIVDCHPGAFKDFLVYVYSGKFEYTSGKIFELYTIAHKYDVELLKSECVVFMMANLTAENVVDAYVIGHRFDEKELKKKSQNFFVENFNEIISNSNWDSLFKEKSTFVNMLIKGMVENAEVKLKEDT